MLASYADRYLDALRDLGDAGMLAAMGVAGTMFPYVAADAAFPERALDTAESSEVSPLLAKLLVDNVDELRRMLAARARS